jgi:hypothetical protein
MGWISTPDGGMSVLTEIGEQVPRAIDLTA